MQIVNKQPSDTVQSVESPVVDFHAGLTMEGQLCTQIKLKTQLKIWLGLRITDIYGSLCRESFQNKLTNYMKQRTLKIGGARLSKIYEHRIEQNTKIRYPVRAKKNSKKIPRQSDHPGVQMYGSAPPGI